MKAYCVCGETFFAEHTTCVCPRCSERITLIWDDSVLAPYRCSVNEVLLRVQRSLGIHGDWSDYSAEQVFDAVTGEFSEYCDAFFDERIGDKHGQIDELKDVITVCLKGIERLKCME